MSLARILGVFVLLLLAAPVGAQHTPTLIFQIETTRQPYVVGHEIGVRFTLKNVSNKRVLATRDAGLHDLVYLEVLNQRKQRVSWSGPIPSRDYTRSLIVLNPGESVTFDSTISDASGRGYRFQSPGKYRIRAEFSLSPKEYFAPAAKGALIPDKPISSNWLSIFVKR